MKQKTLSTPEKLFEGKPEPYKLFSAVKRYIESLGAVTLETTRTQVSFGVKRKFAWVWLPQMWVKNRPETSITLTFELDHEAKDSRIAQAVEVRTGRFTHHVVIEKESDFDDQVKQWLREAYLWVTS